MVDAEASLRAMMEALQGSVLHQLAWLIAHYDRGIVRATWQSWIPSINLEMSSIVVALAIGVTLWLLFLALWHGSQWLVRYLTTSRSRVPPQRREPPPRQQPTLRL
jgi:TRAP-type C4-dicarboxylate transport system permease small subunit